MKHIIAIVMLLAMVGGASALPNLSGSGYNATTANATGGLISDMLGAGVIVLALFMIMQLIGLNTFYDNSVIWFMSIVVSIGMFLMLKTMGYMP